MKALMIIHNILEEFGNDPQSIEGFNGLEDDDVPSIIGEAPERLDLGMNMDEMYQAGLLHRNCLLDLM